MDVKIVKHHLLLLVIVVEVLEVLVENVRVGGRGGLVLVIVSIHLRDAIVLGSVGRRGTGAQVIFGLLRW